MKCRGIQEVRDEARTAWRGYGRIALLAAACCLLASGCKIRREMYDQAKVKPLAQSNFFGDERASRPLLPGTVARGHLNQDAHLYLGLVDGQPATAFPFPVTREMLLRGQERFNIYCAPCHDRAGTGNGMIVQRGYKQPTSYHIDRLRQASPGYFYNVILNGFGQMPSYSYQLSKPEDRWAVVAYVKALQFSQNAVLDDVPEDMRAQLE